MKPSPFPSTVATASTSRNEGDRCAAIAAYFSSGYQGRQPLSQSAIAELGIDGLTSQSAVSRALQRAITLGYLIETTPTLELRALKRDNVFCYVERLVGPVDLQERLKIAANQEGWKRVPRVHGIPVCLDPEESIEKRRRLTRAFFEFAGLTTHELLRDCKNIGVSCG